MTDRIIRDVTVLIRSGGGSAVATTPGGKHTKVTFLDATGIEQFVTIHRGGNPKRYEDALRSQLRRRGLNL